ncbi:MAG: AhpC/TSA family protein [Zoogloeaceae bacterium]|jgi:peroxiredoxin|nr:AhpC/TSA family protein [Zoogloeaceae bacterium]
MPIVSKGDIGIDFTFDTPWDSGKSFFEETQGKKSIVFFLRYFGCTSCQLEIHALIENHAKFDEVGAAVYVVLQSEAATIQNELSREDVPFTIIVDPRQKLYATYAIGSRDPNQDRTLEHKAKIAKAQSLGFSHGKYEGNEYQLPAVFIFGPDHRVLYAHYGQESSDVPDHEILLRVLSEQG